MPKGNLAPGATTISELLRAPSGRIELGTFDPRSTPGFKGKKADGQTELAAHQARLEELQEQLYAQARAGRRAAACCSSCRGSTRPARAGRSGTWSARWIPAASTRRRSASRRRRSSSTTSCGGSAPSCRARARSACSTARTTRTSSRCGCSNLVDKAISVAPLRDDQPLRAALVDGGMEIVKCYLHISPEEQRARLLARLDDPTKQWKYNPDDLATRERWAEYIAAYEHAMARCSTEAAPWHIIPADRKWYRNWAVSSLADRAARGDGPRLAEAGLRRQGGADEAARRCPRRRRAGAGAAGRAARARRPRARPRTRRGGRR